MEGKSLDNYNYRTRHIIHLIWCSFSSRSHSLDPFLLPQGVLFEGNFLDNHNYHTRHTIHLIGCSFSSLTHSLKAQFFRLFFLFPTRVLLNEHFFEYHNYRTSQNIRQRRKRAPDQAYTMTSTVVMIVLKNSFQ